MAIFFSGVTGWGLLEAGSWRGESDIGIAGPEGESGESLVSELQVSSPLVGSDQLDSLM